MSCCGSPPLLFFLDSMPFSLLTLLSHARTTVRLLINVGGPLFTYAVYICTVHTCISR